jgi:hypothetical protein
MDRRAFLTKLLCAAPVIAAPKFIFDMGANLYKMTPPPPVLGATEWMKKDGCLYMYCKAEQSIYPHSICTIADNFGARLANTNSNSLIPRIGVAPKHTNQGEFFWLQVSGPSSIKIY